MQLILLEVSVRQVLQESGAFPGGADLNGPELSGTCNQLTWDLNTNIITGDHGVNMRWYPPKRDEGEPAAGPDAAQPSEAATDTQEAR